MQNLHRINEIKRLAKKFGTPLRNVTFDTNGNGVEFVYSVNGGVSNRYYSNADEGILKEVTRLQNFIRVEESFQTEI